MAGRSACLGALAFAALTALGCSDAGPSEFSLLAALEQGIINGQKDYDHDAVVAIAGEDWACTGTIIAVEGSTGYALTAAHCLDKGQPQIVIQGDDYSAFSATQYQPTASQSHPNYNGDVYDFAMVQFASASGNTPVIPAMKPAQDNLTSNTQVRHVGYGLTSYPNGNTTERHQIVSQLNSLDALKLTYLQPNGGPCQGDSGGPNLTTTGTELVAGVISNGDQGCDEYGNSGRTSAVYNGFIQPFINNTPITGPQNCDECTQFATTGMGPCSGDVQACWNHNDCAAMLECFDGCGGSGFCVQECIKDHLSGYDVYEEIFLCVCDEACPLLCDSEPICNTPDGTVAAATTAATTGAGPTTGSGETTGAGGGSGATSGAGGSDVTPDDAWHAGNRSKDDIDGIILHSCAVANVTPRSRGWLAWLGLCLVLLRRRRSRHAS